MLLFRLDGSKYFIGRQMENLKKGIENEKCNMLYSSSFSF